MKDNKVSLFSLFWSFFKIGLFTFGGGIAMLPMLRKECIEKHSWCDEDEILNYFAIGQCTPGIIAVNTATFVGFKHRKIIGGIVATAGIILPGFLIILFLAAILKAYGNTEIVLKAFSGIRVAVVAIISSALFDLSKKALKNVWCGIIAVAALCLQIVFGLSPVFIVLGTLAFGILMWRFEK